MYGRYSSVKGSVLLRKERLQGLKAETPVEAFNVQGMIEPITSKLYTKQRGKIYASARTASVGSMDT